VEMLVAVRNSSARPRSRISRFTTSCSSRPPAHRRRPDP
jgi:hypothetical protein